MSRFLCVSACLIWIACASPIRAQEAPRPWLGVQTLLDTTMPGARVNVALAGSPAALAGIQDDDVIQTLDGVAIADANALVAAISQRAVGSSVRLTLLRARRRLTLNITLAAAPSPRRYAVGEVFRDCDACPEMVVVPAGSFFMGSPAEEEGRAPQEGPRTLVTVRRPFAISRHEITFAAWDACVQAGGCGGYAPPDQGWGRGARPVIHVNLTDGGAFTKWLNRYAFGASYALPSEAYWEYAARAGSDTPWATGSAIVGEDANILGQYGRTVPVGSFPANAFGLHDVHGNVRELTEGCVDVGYFGVPADGDAPSSGNCSLRSTRGGSYASLPSEARSAARAPVPHNQRSSEVGFRVVRFLPD